MAAPMTQHDFKVYLVNFIKQTAITPNQIAQILDVSTPTVERWLAGVDAPCPVMRPVAIKSLNRTLARA